MALSGSGDKTLKLWMLDWELADKEPANWDEGARPYLEVFLTSHTPYAGTLPKHRNPTDEEITLALTRRGKPVWTEDDFQQLFYTLGCAGYGWLRPEGVRRELEKMAREWQGLPSLVKTAEPPSQVAAALPSSPAPESKGPWLSRLFGKGRK